MRHDTEPHRPYYGATNAGFISDNSPPTAKLVHITPDPPQVPPTLQEEEEDLVAERPEDERESWDSKLTFLLATIG